MVQIDIVYQGQLRCSARHQPSGTEIFTDAPKDNHGKGESFSPTDLVAVALGTCMLTLMGITAQKLGIDLGAVKVTVQKEMSSQPPRRIARLPVIIDVPVAVSGEHKQKLIHAAETCPVHHSLHPDIQKPVEFRWAGQ